jgi:hypothetical protein
MEVQPATFHRLRAGDEPVMTPLSSLRTTALSLFLAPFMIAVALFFVLGTEGMGHEPLWALAAPLVLGAAAAGLVSLVGYRAPAIEPGTPAEEAARRGVAAFQTGLFLRFALCEVPMLVGLVLAFVVRDGGYLVALLGCAVTVVLVGLHVLPGDGPVRRTQESLERAGAQVPLRAALETPSSPTA